MQVCSWDLVARAATAAFLFCGISACEFHPDGYTARPQVAEGLSLATGAKVAILEYHREYGRYPATNDEASLSAPEAISGRHVSKVEVLPGGKVAVTYGGAETDGRISGRVLLLEAIGPGEGGHFTWNCLSSNIDRRHLPSVCRSENASDYRPVLFYLHGRIVEDAGPRPEHPRWGVYDYPAVVEALGRNGAAVVSEQRPSGTNMDDYAAGIVTHIQRLLMAGFPPDRIAVVGFSKGGGIAMRVASQLENPGVRYVLLAACSAGIETVDGLIPNGHVLSIREQSDDIVGTCDGLAARNPELAAYSEVSIATGKEHGAFYVPHEAWLEPALDWVHAAGEEKAQ